MFSDSTVTTIALVVLSMFIAIPFHEAMHGYAARLLGDRTAEYAGRLTLNPLKHVDWLMTVILPAILIAVGLPPIFAAKPVPFDPENVRYEEYGAALVGLAGPFSNLILAAIAALFFNITGVDTGLAYNAFSIFIEVNILLFVFNMIPLPPLDGSRLLYAFAPEPLQRIMYQLESTNLGFIVLAILVFTGILSPFISTTSNAIYNFLV
jgi:Zn-dependent protease